MHVLTHHHTSTTKHECMPQMHLNRWKASTFSSKTTYHSKPSKTSSSHATTTSWPASSCVNSAHITRQVQWEGHQLIANCTQCLKNCPDLQGAQLATATATLESWACLSEVLWLPPCRCSSSWTSVASSAVSQSTASYSCAGRTRRRPPLAS